MHWKEWTEWRTHRNVDNSNSSRSKTKNNGNVSVNRTKTIVVHRQQCNFQSNVSCIVANSVDKNSSEYELCSEQSQTHTHTHTKRRWEMKFRRKYRSNRDERIISEVFKYVQYNRYIVVLSFFFFSSAASVLCCSFRLTHSINEKGTPDNFLALFHVIVYSDESSGFYVLILEFVIVSPLDFDKFCF